MKLNLVLTEYYTTTSWRKLEIDTNDYPLLKGMTEEEVQSYIQNLYEQGVLNNVVGGQWGLEDELRDADIVRDKTGSDDYELELIEDD